MSKGIELITAERERQIVEEGYTPEHDRDHAADLALAAGQYAINAEDYIHGLENPHDVPIDWPWKDEDWKPSGDPIRDLTKAGALIVAAIDALHAEAV
ncbi:hypothetical protein ACYX8G_19260 [Microbacterium saperdae]